MAIDRSKALNLGHLSDFSDSLNNKFAKKATSLEGYGITDAYTKTAADEAIAAAVAAADHLKRKIVASTADINLTAEDASQYIYMVSKSTEGEADKYDEYMVINGSLEKVGDWEVDLSNYVEKETGKGLSTNDYTTAEKEKLAGIAENANNYTHPAYEEAEAAFIKVGRDATGHVVIGDAVAKADLDTLIGEATTTAAGEMSATDKTKLDGVAEGATKVEASTTEGSIVIDGTETAVVTFATDAEVAELLTEKFGA